MTECIKCGKCCDPVFLAAGMLDAVDRVISNPIGETDDNLLSAIFIEQHWNVIEEYDNGSVHLKCDMYDPETKLCTAHASRPPICSHYPWYGRKPEYKKELLPSGCSFWEDIGGESKMQLPIVEIT